MMPFIPYLTDWEEDDSGQWHKVCRNDYGLTREQHEANERAQEEMRREHYEEMDREEFGEDGP